MDISDSDSETEATHSDIIGSSKIEAQKKDEYKSGIDKEIYIYEESCKHLSPIPQVKRPETLTLAIKNLMEAFNNDLPKPSNVEIEAANPNMNVPSVYCENARIHTSTEVNSIIDIAENMKDSTSIEVKSLKDLALQTISSHGYSRCEIGNSSLPAIVQSNIQFDHSKNTSDYQFDHQRHSGKMIQSNIASPHLEAEPAIDRLKSIIFSQDDAVPVQYDEMSKREENRSTGITENSKDTIDSCVQCMLIVSPSNGVSMQTDQVNVCGKSTQISVNSTSKGTQIDNNVTDTSTQTSHDLITVETQTVSSEGVETATNMEDFTPQTTNQSVQCKLNESVYCDCSTDTNDLVKETTTK